MIAPTLTSFIQAIAKIRQLRLIVLPILSPTTLPRELRCLFLIHEWRVWPLIRISVLVHIGVFTWATLVQLVSTKVLLPCSL